MEYGCQLINVTEEYTSQCCGKCTKLSTTYNYREKKCIHCNYKIDRDVNGSRNILIKNINMLIKNESGSNAMDG
jgi:putative transposase